MPGINRFQNRLSGSLLVFGVLCADVACAQDEVPLRFSESVSIDVDSSVRKKLGTVQDYLNLEKWSEAIDLLVRISKTQGDRLIEVSPGSYLNVASYCDVVFTGLPQPALDVYRERFDLPARRLFEAGRSQRDTSLLQRVVREMFVSRFADDALFLLGDISWERGEFSRARHYWEMILPARKQPGADQSRLLLNYPDTDINPADIYARLVLCSIADGDAARSVFERNAFRRLFPDAEGVLAGRKGNWNQILETIADDFQKEKRQLRFDHTETFAHNAKRNGILEKSVDVAGAAWSVPLPRVLFQPSLSRKPAFNESGPLSYYPIIYRDMVLVSDGDRIFAWNLFTGKPYWDQSETENNTSENGSQVETTLPETGAVIFPPGSEFRTSPPLQSLVGVPRFTMTVAEGRLYARLGSSVTSHAKKNRELHSEPIRLVCLDLADKQGALVWRMSSSDLGADWSFEGAPLVQDGRMYVALRRSHPQTQFNVACYEAQTGKPIWNRRICSALPPVNETENYISHNLLTFADETLFFSSDSGAIAALEADDGRIRWIRTYESVLSKQKDNVLRSDHARWGVKPCLFHQGIVFAAPNDFDGLMAIDSRTGLIRWKQTLRGGVRHLLGVGNENVIVSGNRLWGLNYQTGRLVWNLGYDDPSGYGYGRGTLVGEDVWWPMRDEIVVVNQHNGKLQHRIRLSGSPRYESGGNLTIANGHLMIAQPRRLAVFRDAGGRIGLPRKISTKR